MYRFANGLLLFVCLESILWGTDPIVIGDRLEPLIDDFLVAEKTGDLRQVMHSPKPAEVVFVTGKPWEGNTSAYYTIFRDGDLFRMYYRGSHADAQKQSAHREVTCYAESRDGVHWTKPDLGLVEFQGSKHNNIVWDGIGTHCFAVFKDANPACPPTARYKAISRGRPRGKKGLYIFQSPDGVNWKLMAEEPVITDGYFDSQNLAFWDPYARTYRAYHRTFIDGVRAIMTQTSTNYRDWTKPVVLQYPANTPREHLYTNAVFNYPGAEHILVGFPTRYLPKQNSRVEPIMMTSRDGLRFNRWPDPVVPETAPKDRGGNRSNYMTWGMVSLPGKSDEFSVYATEAYYEGPDCRVRRFVFRKDGLVSLSANQGSATTHAIRFVGKELVLNYRTRKRGGSIRVEVQDASGRPLQGLALADCCPLVGDQIEQQVIWERDTQLSRWAGKPIRLRFVVQDADLFSLRFR
ncbi:MAG: hypothetical protein CMJ75_09460 [Planctomycetaceae bacterium]|nr:hypothetical protein [Planctomycetaceae bacterium]